MHGKVLLSAFTIQKQPTVSKQKNRERDTHEAESQRGDDTCLQQEKTANVGDI